MDRDDDAAEVTRHREAEALADVRSVLQLCAAGQLRASATTSRASAASVGVVAQHLSGGDFYPDQPIAAFAWPLLVQAGGLASVAGGKLTLTAAGRRALTQDPAEVVRLLWRRWLSHGLIDEFSRVEAIKGQRSANTLSAVKRRRAVVGEALEQCVGPAWVGVDDLFALMRRRDLDPSVERSDRALWNLYLEHREYGSLGYAGYHGWSILQGRYTLAVVFEYAATLGLVDVRYTDPVGARHDFRDQWGTDALDFLSRYDGLLAVRRTALGRYCLGLDDAYVAPRAPSPTASAGTAAADAVLRVLDTLDVVLTGELPAGDRLLLSAFAAQTGDRVWTITLASLLGALDAGRTLEEFTTFLSSRTTTALPQVLTTLVRDAAGRAARLTSQGVLLVVECDDAATAAMIVRDRRVGRFVRPLGDRHLGIVPEQEAAARSALVKAGYVLPSGAL